MKWILFFLAFVFAGEIIAAWFFYRLEYTRNTIVYYFISIAEIIFYSNFFCYYIRSGAYKTIILLIVILFGVFGITAMILWINYTAYIIYFIAEGFFLALIALCYLYACFTKEDDMKLIAEPGFWVAFGVAIFFSACSIVYSLHDVIVAKDLKIWGTMLYNIVPRILSVILYTSFSVAIILSAKQVCTKDNKLTKNKRG